MASACQAESREFDSRYPHYHVLTGVGCCITAKVSTGAASLLVNDVGAVRTGFSGSRRVGLHFNGKLKALTSVAPRSRKRALGGSYKQSWFDSRTPHQNQALIFQWSGKPTFNRRSAGSIPRECTALQLLRAQSHGALGNWI